MSILNNLTLQKSAQYNTIIENEIYFSDNISSIMRKVGTPKNIEKANAQTTLEYKRKLHFLISAAYYCFQRGKLCSVCYETDTLTDDESKHFLSEIENLINENISDSVIRYRCCGKEYWELSDGVVSMCICVYIENDKAHIKINYLD